MEQKIPRVNNFDLIRLLAAFQVVYGHSVAHLKIDNSLIIFFSGFIKYFPGVPIFFTVSGFLIFWAFDRKQILKQYIFNRILRLYPALYVCLALTITLLVLSSSAKLLTHTSFYAWILTQMSFFQFYTPDILRFWGVGTPNGSLWTIAVEVQFYIVVPLVFLLLRKIKSGVLLTTLILTSILANFALASMPENIIQKLSFVSIIPYLFNFLLGSVFYIFWIKISKIVRNKFLVWLGVYIAYTVIFGEIMGYKLISYQMNNIFQPITVIILSCLTLSFAFSFNNLSEKILKHNDISYGIYIYHMLVINTLVNAGFINDTKYFILVFIVTIVLAYASWKLIEKPALSLKSRF